MTHQEDREFARKLRFNAMIKPLNESSVDTETRMCELLNKAADLIEVLSAKSRPGDSK